MANKKAQGLPLNLIVIAAIAALILVLVIAFTIGGFGTFFSKIFGAGQTAIGDDVDIVKTTCNGYCDTAKGLSTTTAFKSSQYCTKEFDVDIDGDGILGGYDVNGAELSGGEYSSKSTALVPEKEIDLHCDESPINVKCSTTVADESDC